MNADNEAIMIGRLINDGGQNVAMRLAKELGISRQSASAKLARLRKQGLIAVEGTGRGTTYSLGIVASMEQSFPREGLSEDIVWREFCAPVLAGLPENVRNIWHHGMTEMINNAVDHSGATEVRVSIARTLFDTWSSVADNGGGIFLKIQRALNLYDPREAILELAKGKFTTDPAHHSGEGIFFSSKMFDHFSINSGDLMFSHDKGTPDILFEHQREVDGTQVSMFLQNDSKRTTKEIFDQFALPEDFSFAKTIVPVRLAQHEGEKLVSRSQAKRLVRRFERFKTVILDFKDVAEIGQGFADEVFRVFRAAHPDTELHPINMPEPVRRMVYRVENG